MRFESSVVAGREWSNPILPKMRQHPVCLEDTV